MQVVLLPFPSPYLYTHLSSVVFCPNFYLFLSFFCFFSLVPLLASPLPPYLTFVYVFPLSASSFRITHASFISFSSSFLFPSPAHSSLCLQYLFTSSLLVIFSLSSRPVLPSFTNHIHGNLKSRNNMPWNAKKAVIIVCISDLDTELESIISSMAEYMERLHLVYWLQIDDVVYMLRVVFLSNQDDDFQWF